MKPSNINRPKRGKYTYDTNATTLTPVLIGGVGTRLEYQEVTDKSLNNTSNSMYQYKTLKDDKGNIINPNDIHNINEQYKLGTSTKIITDSGTREWDEQVQDGTETVQVGTNIIITGSGINRAWRSGPNMNNARNCSGMVGTINSALIIGGSPSIDYVISSTSNMYTNCESFNGSTYSIASFTNITGNFGYGDFSTPSETYTNAVPRTYFAACGNISSCLIAGGRTGETQNQTSLTAYLIANTWTKSANMNYNRAANGLCGSYNSALVVGGETSTDSYTVYTEVFNGSVWSNSTNMNVSRYALNESGIQNDALVVGGKEYYGGRPLQTCEKFNGLAWSTTGNAISGRANFVHAGVTNSAISSTGEVHITSQGYVETSETFNGSIWTSDLSSSCYRYGAFGCGTRDNLILAGGVIDMGPSEYGGRIRGTTTSTEMYISTPWQTTREDPIYETRPKYKNIHHSEPWEESYIETTENNKYRITSDYPLKLD